MNKKQIKQADKALKIIQKLILDSVVSGKEGFIQISEQRDSVRVSMHTKYGKIMVISQKYEGYGLNEENDKVALLPTRKA